MTTYTPTGRLAYDVGPVPVPLIVRSNPEQQAAALATLVRHGCLDLGPMLGLTEERR